MRYENKVVLVTGGASGIGRAVLDGMVREGARVMFTDISNEVGQSLEAELRSDGHDVRFGRADATDPDDATRIVADVVNEWGRLDVAINNVGGPGRGDKSGGPLEALDPAAWRATFALSSESTFYGMRAQIAQMLAQGGGVIGNTASMAGVRPTLTASVAYSAAKASVIQLTRYAALMYADRGIRINAVAPGMTLTPAVEAHLTPEEQQAFVAGIQPMGRMLKPSEIADSFLWLCSDEASGVTGITVNVDAGLSAA